MSIILSTAYNAPIQYYTKFLFNQPIVIEQYDSYIKQTYRTRCSIHSTDGAMSLSIPVSYSSQEKTKTKDVLISDHGNWQHTHWNAIVSAYNSTPFFEYYRDDYEKFYRNKYESLLHFNDELLRLTLSNLNVDVPQISYTNEYLSELSSEDVDYRETIHPKRDYEQDKQFVAREYYQIFSDKNGFIPNLSILDLLFNMGNESLLVLKDCIK